MNPNSYAVGTQVTMTGTFRDINGNLVDPTFVTAMVDTPNQQLVDVTSTVINVSPGVYTVTYTPTVPGGHDYKMQGSGNCQISAYGSFIATALF